MPRRSSAFLTSDVFDPELCSTISGISFSVGSFVASVRDQRQAEVQDAGDCEPPFVAPRTHTAPTIANSTKCARGGRVCTAPAGKRRATGVTIVQEITSSSQATSREIRPLLASSLPSRFQQETSLGADGNPTKAGVGVQAASGKPLVPRPSSPRPQAECHPWYVHETLTA